MAVVQKKNPFKSAKTVNEFLKMLRADLERLRGAKFALWRVISVYEVGNARINVTIDSTRTICQDKVWAYSWYEIAEAAAPWAFKRGTRLNEWTGYKLFEFVTDHGGSRKNSICATATIELKHLPHIYKMWLRNAHLKEERNRVGDDDADVIKFAAKIAQLQAELSAQKVLLDKRIHDLSVEYDQTNPHADLCTGKPLYMDSRTGQALLECPQTAERRRQVAERRRRQTAKRQ